MARLRVCGLSLPLLLLPLLSCGQSPNEFGTVEGFQELKDILLRTHGDYQVLDVIDEGRMLRVDITPEILPADRFETRIQATNILYDLQTHTGKDLSVSVWLYRSSRRQDADLLGMAFYHALTEQVVFKTPEEIPER